MLSLLFANMTPGESFGASLWVVIFLPTAHPRDHLRYEMYERPLEDGSGGGTNTYSTFKESTEDEIAE